MNKVAVGAMVACVAGAGLVLAIKGPLSATGEPVAKSVQQVKNISLLNGVWRSRGYGWLADIQDGDISFYDETDRFCTPWINDPDVDPLGARIEISNDGLEIKLPVTDEAFLHTFDKIGALPEACSADPDATPRAVLDAVIDLFTNHYAFFEQRNVEWPELAAASRQKLGASASEDELLEVLGDMFSDVDDAHVSLQGESNGVEVLRETGDGKTLTRVAAQGVRSGVSPDDMIDRWEDSYWEQDVAETLLRGKGVRAANDQVAYGFIDGDIGYIAIRSMEGFDDDAENVEDEIAAIDRAMEPAMKLFQDARAVIVDISINDGGYDQAGRAFASRFAAERAVAYYKHAGDAEAGPSAGDPHRSPNPGTPLHGPGLSCDIRCLRQCSGNFHHVHAGTPLMSNNLGGATRGCTIGYAAQEIAQWLVVEPFKTKSISMQKGANFGKARVSPPHVPMTIFSEADVNKGHVEAIRKVVGMIRQPRVRPWPHRPRLEFSRRRTTRSRKYRILGKICS